LSLQSPKTIGKENRSKQPRTKRLSAFHEAVNNRIDPIREQLPVELQESVGTQLEGVFQVVGRTHNDAGHPTGRVIEKEEAYALCPAFSSLCQKLMCADGLAKGEQDIELLANWLSSSGEES
jgi:hypothetical protein